MTLGVVALVLLGLWGIHVWRYPYVTCKHCDGEKWQHDSDRCHKRLTDCPWCLRDGYRYRWELRWFFAL